MFRIILLFTGIITLISCQNSHRDCFDDYSFDSEFDKRLYVMIDSSMTTRVGCSYFIDTYIPLADSSIAKQAIMYLTDNKLYLKLERPESDDFVLFDLEIPEKKEQCVEINYADTVKRFNCILEEKIITIDKLLVYRYRVEDLFYYYPDIEFTSSLDVIFFVTKEFGIIGTYLTDIEFDGAEVMIAPAGNIFKDYIDYSEIKLRKLI